MSFEHLDKTGQLVFNLYRQGQTYKEICRITGEPYEKVYGLIYRQVRAGNLQYRPRAKSVIKNKALASMKIGKLGPIVRSLDADQIVRLAGKIKRKETVSEMLIRLVVGKL